MRPIQCCVDRARPAALQDDVRARVSTTGDTGSPGRAAALTSTLWTPGQTITIGFLGDRPPAESSLRATAIEQRIERIAREWTQHANLRFELVDSDAAIRVAFAPGGSWSYIGRQCLEVPPEQPTMNFGWFTEELAESEFRRTVLHEFGHALGLIHEHQHPANGIRWNKAALYAYYQGPPNRWSKHDVDHNVCATYAADRTQYTAVDRSSIMMYPIPPEHTEDGFHVDWNDDLSEWDTAFIRRLYPR